MHNVASDEYSLNEIDHKFTILSHSFLLIERDFAQIEQSCKEVMQIYVPEDWENVVRQAHRKNPFTVSRMKGGSHVTKAPKSSDRQSQSEYPWYEGGVVQHQLDSSQPLQFRYRYSNNTLEHWKTVNLKSKPRGCRTDMGKIVLPALYTRPRIVNAKKVSDQ